MASTSIGPAALLLLLLLSDGMNGARVLPGNIRDSLVRLNGPAGFKHCQETQTAA